MEVEAALEQMQKELKAIEHEIKSIKKKVNAKVEPIIVEKVSEKELPEKTRRLIKKVDKAVKSSNKKELGSIDELAKR